MASFSPKSEAELLVDLGAAVRSGTGDPATLTTADDLRGFLKVLVKELVNRTNGSGIGSGTLTAPNGLAYVLTVGNDGTVHLVPADGQPLPDPTGLLTAPNGLTYRLSVADDGTVSAVPASGLIDPDADAFIAAAGLQNVAHQEAVNKLVRALKVSNIWPRLRACYPMVGGTAQAHALNLKDPRDADAAFRLTFYNGPRHSELGVGWNGVNQYADTHFVPAGALPAFSNHLAYYATTEGNNAGRIEVDLGTEDGHYFSLLLQYQGGMAFDTNHTSVYTAGPVGGLGFGVGSQQNITTANLYRDGKLLAISSAAQQADDYPRTSLLMGTRQEGFSSQKTCGFASVGEGLSTEEVAAYSAAVLAFQQQLGRARDADAAAFSQAAGVQDTSQVLALHQLVSDLKAGGVWDRLHACYPMVGGTAQAHALNLKDPRDADAAFRLTFYNDPAHTPRGVEWNGSQYADSHYYPAYHLSTQTNHLAYYAVTDEDPREPHIELGSEGNGGTFSLFARWSGAINGSRFEIGDFVQNSVPLDAGLGFTLVGRENATNVFMYRNGYPLALAANGGTGNSLPAAPLLLAHRQDGYFSCKTCGFASVGDGLTPVQAVAYSMAVATFQRALNRAVV